MLRYLVYYQGMYVRFSPPQTVDVPVRAGGDSLRIRDKEGTYRHFLVKGVEIEASLPGNFNTDFAPEHEDYLRWMTMIGDMGANTIRVYTIMDDEFYNALFAYNTAQEAAGGSVLYLLQGIRVTDYAGNSAKDAYDRSFLGELIQDAVAAVDVLHGERIIPLNRVKGSGTYGKDISRWVLGYVVGLEWNTRTIAFTDHIRANEALYQGEYFSAAPEATPFESMLAQVMDRIVSYETAKYGQQHPVSFINAPESDPFVYDEEYASQLSKYAVVDGEHIVTGEKNEAGYFICYNVYEFCPNFAEYLDEKEKVHLAPYLAGLDTSLYYEGYTQLLTRYHSVPVLVTGYGFSTARGVDQVTTFGGEDVYALTEAQQGQALVDAYADFVRSDCAGAVINSWQDVWGQRTWNTLHAVDVNGAPNWHDVQTNDQGYGLLAFEPGETPACLVDGDYSEWEEALAPQEGMIRLYVRYDARGMYFLAVKPSLSMQQTLYIAIDTTQKSGGIVCKEPALSFSRNVDFLLCIDGDENSRLLVHERSDALRARYLTETTGVDPYYIEPDVNSSVFNPVTMILKLRGVLEEAYTDDGLRMRRLHETYETGRLVMGNANPQGTRYLSTADFCYGQDCVEVRIPWQMLNFSDPADMLIHDDYYQHFGVENQSIDRLYVGIGTGENPIELSPVKLTPWGESVKFTERCKQSYFIVSDYWQSEALTYGDTN